MGPKTLTAATGAACEPGQPQLPATVQRSQTAEAGSLSPGQATELDYFMALKTF